MNYHSVDEVISGQEIQLEIYGGGYPGVLKAGALESAVLDVQQTWGGELLITDPFEVAAKYLDSFMHNHAFHNGNKRVALGTALEFLYRNGVRVEGDDLPRMNEALVALVLNTVQGEKRLDKEDVAAFFRAHARMVPCAESDASEALAEARAWMHQLYAPTFEILAQ